MRRSLTLLVALVATILFTSTPATAGEHTKAVDTTQVELEAEIAYRCVLYSAHQEASARAEMWRSLRESADLMSSTDEATTADLFDRFKAELRAGIDSTPYDLGFAGLERQLVRDHEHFEFDSAAFETRLIYRRIAWRADTIAEKIRDNDVRLERDNPAALRARIPLDCPRAM